MNNFFNCINTENLLQNLSAGVIIYKMDDTVTYANKKALDIIGLSWQQLIGEVNIPQEWHLVDENGQRLQKKRLSC
jgi:nitrogen fixation/metabolism regulation signal transduction histidine kinase